MLRGIILITEKSNFFSIFVKTYTAAGYGTLPICMAKTQYSLSTDAAAKVIYLLQPFSLSDVLVTVQQYSHNVFVFNDGREFQLDSEFLFAMYALLSVQVTSTLSVETS